MFTFAVVRISLVLSNFNLSHILEGRYYLLDSQIKAIEVYCKLKHPVGFCYLLGKPQRKMIKK
jgi:hypothetical protein